VIYAVPYYGGPYTPYYYDPNMGYFYYETQPGAPYAPATPPSPEQPPADYPVWPLWYAALAWVHVRQAGGLLVVGLALGATLAAV